MSDCVDRRELWWNSEVRLYGLVLAVAAAVGVQACDLAGGNLPVQVASSGVPFLYVPLNSRAAVDGASIRAEDGATPCREKLNANPELNQERSAHAKILRRSNPREQFPSSADLTDVDNPYHVNWRA
jgi:hypothetical protein